MSSIPATKGIYKDSHRWVPDQIDYSGSCNDSAKENEVIKPKTFDYEETRWSSLNITSGQQILLTTVCLPLC